MQPENDFLPISKKDIKKRGWSRPDFVYVSGDAYVDHPSFGMAIITRLLEDAGYKVAVIAQPDWKDDASITLFGEPRLAFLVSAGNMDSMVNHYTSFKKRRHQDAYTPGGGFSRRPDRATIVYGNLIRKTYKKTPILIGGIEASLRRMAHYDYWNDKIRRSILLDSGADLLMYGMGEHAVLELAEALDAGISVKDITYVRGTVFCCKDLADLAGDYQMLPSFEDITRSKEAFAKSYYIQYQNTDAVTAKRLVEPYKEKEYIVQNPPAYPLTTEEMDHVYELPYMREPHPVYDEEGGVPAIHEVRFSLVSNRGCFGGCSFCALTFHQGRRIQVRSHDSILQEAEAMTRDPHFKGYIHDVGGPTADFRQPACKKQIEKGVCKDRQCLFPHPCPALNPDHSDYMTLLKKLRRIPGVKKVFIRSGIRFDYVLADKNKEFLSELCRHHVSGQLKVAPEHICDPVLALMGKPSNEVYEQFAKAYKRTNEKLKKKQYLVPYLMSSHPGSGLEEAVALAEYIRDLGYMPEQVQDFYPTPGTISTCMYYTGLDPRTMKPVYVPHSLREKQMQRALIQYRNPDNYDIVKAALLKAGREDLIGYGKNCLIPPRKPGEKNAGKPSKTTGTRKESGRNRGTAGGSKGSGAGSKGSGAGSKGSGTGSKGSGTGSKGSGTGSKGSGTGNRGRKPIRNLHKAKKNGGLL